MSDEKAVFDLVAELNERLDQAIAKNVQKRTARTKERAEMAERRLHGKASYHAAKLAKNRQEKQP
jgi:hypothetical protein